MRDKRAKFIELAEARVGRAIKSIRLVANLSNRNNYDFDAADVTKILGALEAEIRDLRLKFRVSPGKGIPEFRL
jgi:hypothetical protein